MNFGRKGLGEAKIAPRLLAQVEVAEARERFPVLVTFRSAQARAKVLRQKSLPGASFQLTPTAALTASRDQVADLSRSSEVAMVWPDLEMHTCLDVSVPLIGAHRAWEAGYTGAGIRIGVIDTGVDVTHPDLAGRIVATHDATGEGFDDANGHGTHVCGIAAGAGAVFRGVAPGAELVVVKVLRRNGFGQMSWVMQGLEWIVSQGVQVINMSLGGPGPSDGSDPLSQTCEVVCRRGITICVAGGNDGPQGRIGPPGAAPSVITVGASTDQDQVADFSSRGPTADGRPKPDVLLPGHGIIAARAKGSRMGTPVDDLYTQASGTSMAAPHAAGAVAILLEARPGLTPADVKALLERTARSLGAPATEQGRGRVQLDQALGRDLGTVPRPPAPATPGPEPAPGQPGPGTPAPVMPRGCLASLPSMRWRGRGGSGES